MLTKTRQTLCGSSLKGAWSTFWSNYIFLFLSFPMLQEYISIHQPKFEGQSQSHKQNTGLTILSHVNKAQQGSCPVLFT